MLEKENTSRRRRSVGLDPPAEQRLCERLGEARYRQRVRRQVYSNPHVFMGPKVWLAPEVFSSVRTVMTWILRTTGHYQTGYAEAQKFRRIENTLYFPDLPPAFEGFRILHVSDFHADFAPHIIEAFLPCLENETYDLCVITGDFKGECWGEPSAALREAERYLKHFHKPIYAVMGNHDFIEQVPILESLGVHVLLNEHVAIERNGAHLYFVGIDDPHYFRTHDLEQATRGIPPGVPTILLTHSAEILDEVSQFNIHVILSGHTHGGQLCRSIGKPFVRRFYPHAETMYGAWRYNGIQGYTTSGVGCSVLPIRINCPPEYVIHTLKRGLPPDASGARTFPCED
jgi:predicted MPP superfamily phosphohydrolase